MVVFTFVCRSSGKNWSAKQVSGDLEASAATTYELQRKLVQSAEASDSSGTVQSSFSLITPTSAVFQVIIGGPTFIGGGVAAAAPAARGAADTQAAPAEEKEEVKEESDDEDLGFSLFD